MAVQTHVVKNKKKISNYSLYGFEKISTVYVNMRMTILKTYWKRSMM